MMKPSPLNDGICATVYVYAFIDRSSTVYICHFTNVLIFHLILIYYFQQKTPSLPLF